MASLKEKIQRASPFSGVMVPILIVLVAALLIFGVTAMLRPQKNYYSLVEELENKTFGNRWVAAYELSKYLSQASFPKEDIPWLIEKLSSLYKKNQDDPKSRRFIILALGPLKRPEILPTLESALSDPDKDVVFSALSVLGQFSAGEIQRFNWEKVLALLQSQDEILLQTAIVIAVYHAIPTVQNQLRALLAHTSAAIRYTSAIALAHFNDSEGISILEEICHLRPSSATSTGEAFLQSEGSFSALQIEANKLNIIEAFAGAKVRYGKLNPAFQKIIDQLAHHEKSVRVQTAAQELLLMLKK